MLSQKDKRSGLAPPEETPPAGSNPGRSGEGLDSVLPALREQEEQQQERRKPVDEQ